LDHTAHASPIGRVVNAPIQAVIAIGGGLSLVLLGWSIFGSLPSEVTGTGMVVRGKRLIAVEARVPGTVVASNAEVNQQVRKTEILMSIDSSQQRIQLDGAKKQLATGLSLGKVSEQSGASAEANALSALRTAELRLKSQGPALQRRRSEIEALMQQANRLYSQRLINATDLANLGQTLGAVTSQLQSLTDAVNSQNLQYQQVKQQNAGNRFQIQQQNLSTAVSAASVNEIIKQSRAIRSPVNGELVSISKAVGDYANQGDVLFTLMPRDGSLRAILLVSSTNANRVKAGNQVLISPNESPPTRFGYIKGIVSGISNAPATQAELIKAFGSAETAQSFANTFGQQAGIELPYLAVVSIQQNKAGLPVWTLGKQPPWGFRAGGVTSARIITSQIRPIQLLVPSLRKL
jgi:HlyD family secretion protein